MTGEDIFPSLELMRICVNRRVYTSDHLRVIANALGDIYDKRDSYRGMKMIFTAS